MPMGESNLGAWEGPETKRIATTLPYPWSMV